MGSQMEKVIGIDLGTTNSCVAVMENGTATVIANRGGYKTTPSMVAISESGRRLVGHIAKRQAVTNAENTVYAAKRVIGRKWNHEHVQKAATDMPYSIISGDNGDTRIKMRDQVFTIPEISAMVLTEMKKIAEEYFGEPVSKAVVTIPAYFNDGQRQATKDAGKIAGLDVIRIINEPTAASLAYGHRKGFQKKIAVYDLGGGTFDVSVLELGDGVFEVLSTSGDTFLGGEDFDRRIVDWLDERFQQENQMSLRSDPMSLQRLRDAAEKAKIELSEAMTTEINLPFIISDGANEALHLHCTITREDLETITQDLVERTIETCAKTLEEAKVSPAELEDVILVGGQTRMPKVQEAVRAFFGRDPNKTVHPDEAVALGAAVQGDSLLTLEDDGPELLLLDVTPHHLGIMIAGGLFQTLIPANSTVPTNAQHIFTTAQDNQTAVKIVVLQGDSRLAARNELLGEFMLTGIREAPRGEVEIEVTFEISADGIVSVSAKDLETGIAQSIHITASGNLADEELQRIIEDNQKYAIVEKSIEEFQVIRTEVERSMREVEKLIPVVQSVITSSEFGPDALRKAEMLIERGKQAIEAKDLETLKPVKEHLDLTAQVFKGLAARAG